MSMVYFENISIDFNDAVVCLDIDGTLVEDGGERLKRAVIEKIEKMKLKNQIYICTNMRDMKRKKMFEDLLSLQSIASDSKKPSKNFLKSMVKNNKQIIVIGDKMLTDGILAKRMGARFIKVQRKKSGRDSWITKASYILDDVYSKFFYSTK